MQSHQMNMRLLCMVDLIFLFKRFNAEKLCSEMIFVARATKTNFINWKASAKNGCFDAGSALKKLIILESDQKFQPSEKF